MLLVLLKHATERKKHTNKGTKNNNIYLGNKDNFSFIAGGNNQKQGINTLFDVVR